MKYLPILFLMAGCASVDSITPPKFSPPISDYRHGDEAIVNTNGTQYDGFFDGKIVTVVGIKDSIIECEYIHGDHTDTLRLAAVDLIKERDK